MPLLITSTPPATGIGTYSQRYLTIGGVTMATGSGAVDSYGCRWILESVTGWDGSPAPVGGEVQRAGASGVRLNPGYRAGRLIAVTGSIGTDWATGNAAIARLNTAAPFNATTTMVVGGAGPELQADVRQNGELLVTSTQTVTRFSLSLIAPDPRRYETTAQTYATGLPAHTGGLSLPISLPVTVGAVVASGQLTLVNDGNADAPALVSVSGPCPAWTVTHIESGKRLTSGTALTAGHTVTLDTGNQKAIADGTAYVPVTGSWFRLAPGTNTVALSAATFDPGASMSVTFRPAWQ